MKTLSQILFVIIFTGCGTLPEREEARQAPTKGRCSLRLLASIHDMAFSEFLTSFVQDAREYETECMYTNAMHFDTAIVSEETPGLSGEQVGYCMAPVRIVISKKFWQDSDYIEKKNLIYHELGHCALGLDHTASETLAIMNPYLLPPRLAQKNWETLVREMFVDARSRVWR